jgi:hypothetical protein
MIKKVSCCKNRLDLSCCPLLFSSFFLNIVFDILVRRIARQANFIGDPIYNKWGDNMALNSSYLTHWTYAMVNVYFLLSVIAMMRAQEGRVRSKNEGF